MSHKHRPTATLSVTDTHISYALWSEQALAARLYRSRQASKETVCFNFYASAEDPNIVVPTIFLQNSPRPMASYTDCVSFGLVNSKKIATVSIEQAIRFFGKNDLDIKQQAHEITQSVQAYKAKDELLALIGQSPA